MQMSKFLNYLLLTMLVVSLVQPIYCQRKREITRPSDKKDEKQTYYELLEVEQTASDREIRKAYLKLSLLHHPDKASEAEKEEKQAIFVKLANAYEILSDKVTRARYDHLLASGIYEYDTQRNWDDFDEAHGFKKAKKKTTFKDAREQFKDAEDEDFWALLISFGVSGGVALIPGYLAWRARQKKNQPAVVPVSELKENQAAAEEFERERLKALEEEKQVRREENARMRAEAERLRAEGQDGEAAEGEQSLDAEEDPEGREEGGDRPAKGGGSVFKCEVCNKKFKSDNQFQNHLASKKHKDAVKAAEKIVARDKGERKAPAAAAAASEGELDSEKQAKDKDKKAKAKQAGKGKKDKKKAELERLSREVGKEAEEAHAVADDGDDD